MIEIQAPNPLVDSKDDLKIFLAGSIDMNRAERWQQKVVDTFRGYSFIFYNPRRNDFNSQLEQSIRCQEFVEQVEWELNALENADVIIYYFDTNGQAPITLFELGLFAKSNKKLIVCCPEGYWRKGNVDVVCRRFGIQQIEAKSAEEFCDKLRSVLTRAALNKLKERNADKPSELAISEAISVYEKETQTRNAEYNSMAIRGENGV